MDVRPGVRLSKYNGGIREWFYEMKNDSHYSIYLRNGSAFKYVLSLSLSVMTYSYLSIFRCDCTVKIDGVEQGTFRLNPYCGYSIERPVNEGKTGRFTFVSEEAIEAMTEKERDQAGISLDNADNGLVEARFVPEAAYLATLPRQMTVDKPMSRRRMRTSKMKSAWEKRAEAVTVQDISTTHEDTDWATPALALLASSSSSSSDYDEYLEEASSTYVSGATMLKGTSDQLQWRATNLQMAEEAAVVIKARLVVRKPDAQVAAEID